MSQAGSHSAVGDPALLGVQLWSYQTPMRQPLVLRQQQQSQTLSIRQGWLLKWTDNQRSWFSEVAPLALFSAESLAFAKSQICQFFAAQHHLDENWQTQLTKLAPSVSWGIGMGLSLMSTNPNAQAHSLVSNAWLSWAALEAGLSTSQLAQVRQHHGGLIKGKPTHVDPVACAEQCARIASELPDDIRLRIDLNQRFNASQAMKFAERLQSLPGRSQIAYVEEPLQPGQSLAFFCQQTGLACAADETFQQRTNVDLQALKHVPVWILKPTLLGWSRTVKLMDYAKHNQIQIQLSNTLESSFHEASWQWLASHYALQNSVHGLDSSAWLGKAELSFEEQLCG